LKGKLNTYRSTMTLRLLVCLFYVLVLDAGLFSVFLIRGVRRDEVVQCVLCIILTSFPPTNVVLIFDSKLLEGHSETLFITNCFQNLHSMFAVASRKYISLSSEAHVHLF